MSKKFFNKIKKLTKNDMAFVANEENNIYSVKEYHDTGCYILNAALSGDIFGGIVDGKRYQFAGPSSTAKSYLTAYCLKSYLDKFSKAECIFFESEGATLLEILSSVNCDMSRVHIFPIATVEDFRNQCFAVLDNIIEERKEGNENKYIVCLDSLGMLSTETELKQVKDMSNANDMSKARMVRAIGRVTSLKFSLAQVPFIFVNHSYKTMEMFSQTVVNGGEGSVYMSDVILIPTKGKEKEGTQQIGCKFGLGVLKSRLHREGLRTYITIHFSKGLYKYSDLEDWGKKLDVFKKEGNSYILPDGQKVKTTTLRKKFKEYANEINMNALADAIRKEFKFGQLQEDDSDFSDIEDDTDIIEEVIENETEE
jgi:hypothetical protein